MKPKLQLRGNDIFDILVQNQRQRRGAPRHFALPPRECYWLRRDLRPHLYLRVDGSSASARRLTAVR